MSFEYFVRTGRDAAFYDERIAPRLPSAIFDVHTHVTRPQYVRKVTEEMISSNWALQTGFVMSAKELDKCFAVLFPGVQHTYNAFAFPLPQANIKGANKYVAQCIEEGWIRSGFLCSTPDFDPDYLERLFLMDGFSGMKVVPDVFSRDSRTQAEIRDLVTNQQCELAEQVGKPVLLHVPRTAGLADTRNISAIQQLRSDFPGLMLVIAHFGSCASPAAFAEALDALGDAAKWAYFDCSMVADPAYYDIAFETLSADHILFGTDEPIALWHGKQVLTDKGSAFVVREDFPWNTHPEGLEAEEGYTFFVYEQMAALLDAAERHGMAQDAIAGILGQNAVELLGLDQTV